VFVAGWLGCLTQSESAVVLRDGSVAHIRTVQPADEAGLLQFLQSLPENDRRLRFFSLGSNLARVAHDEANLDEQTAHGLIVTAEPTQRIVGHAQFVVDGEERAEVAFAIAPDYQGRGLATIMLGQLAESQLLPHRQRSGAGALNTSATRITFRTAIQTRAIGETATSRVEVFIR
jgi:GNAT superfamily N-acetyltransferase